MNKPLNILLCRESITQINELIEELDKVRDMINSREAWMITNSLPSSIRDKVARSIDTEFRAREDVIKQILKDQFQVTKV